MPTEPAYVLYRARLAEQFTNTTNRVVFIGPIAFHNIGWRTYIIFAATNFAIVPLVYFFYPETAYRSLEEVDVLFHLANETPGNPWLSVVKISLNEPLWFGKNGEKPFDYENSDWHQGYMHMMGSGSGTTLEGSGHQRDKTSSGEGSGSGGTQGRNNTPNAEGVIGKAVSPEDDSPNSFGTGSGLSEKRFVEQRRRERDARSSTGTGTTAVSRYSDRPPLPDEPQDSYQSAHSAHSDPNWSVSDMAPPPLRVPSRDSTRSTITGRSNSNSINYPGRIVGYPRLRSDEAQHYQGGLVHTASGRQTYLPDGMSDTSSTVQYLPDSVEQQMREVLGRAGVVLGEGDRVVFGADGRAVVRPGVGSRSSSYSHRVARDAGRGH